jgi:hypothetical protein
MKKLLTCLLFASQIALCQQSQKTEKKTETYRYGYDGMEYIATSKKGTVIISTFNSKSQIRQEIARKIYAMYLDNRIGNNTSLTIVGNDAQVIGRCVVQKKDKLTAVNFYYQKVCWRSGLTEIHEQSLGLASL